MYSFGFGFILCVLYDALRMIRRLFTQKTAGIIVQDTLFFCVSALAVFCFLLVCDYGKIRMYTLSALVLGFAVCSLSFGSLVIALSDKLSDYFHKLLRLVGLPFRRLFSLIRSPAYKIKKIVAKKGSVFKNKLKLLLQNNKQ